MVLRSLLFALPGLLVALGSFGVAAAALRRAATPRARWLAALLVSLGGFALLGWAMRPWVTDPATAFILGTALLAWETLLHGVLLGLVAHVEPARGRWLRTPLGVRTVAACLGAWVVALLVFPTSFIGRVGPLDGVPGLYRLDAGALGALWAAFIVGVRVLAVWVAFGPRAPDVDLGRQRGRSVFAWSLVGFLGLFLVWLSNPVVIYFTGAGYLPGPVRFALPLVWTAVLVAGATGHLGSWGRDPTR